MTSKTVTISVETGRLERSRDFTHFVQKANEYKSVISIMEDNRKVNAKSLLGVMALGLCPGMSVTLSAEGPDETDAVNELVAMMV